MYAEMAETVVPVKDQRNGAGRGNLPRAFSHLDSQAQHFARPGLAGGAWKGLEEN